MKKAVITLTGQEMLVPLDPMVLDHCLIIHWEQKQVVEASLFSLMFSKVNLEVVRYSWCCQVFHRFFCHDVAYRNIMTAEAGRNIEVTTQLACLLICLPTCLPYFKILGCFSRQFICALKHLLIIALSVLINLNLLHSSKHNWCFLLLYWSEVDRWPVEVLVIRG